MDLDYIKTLKVDELKSYLRLRGLKVGGRKDELVARVFCASENDVPVVKTALEIEQDLKNEYEKKLTIGDEPIPDPFLIEDGWLKEDEGRAFWPMTLYADIYISFWNFTPVNLEVQI